MQKQNRSTIFGDFATFSTLVILFASAVALVGCGGGGGGSTAPGSPDVPRYFEDEPNQTWQLANIVNPTTPRYEVEGNIHHNDIDHIACALPSIDGHVVDFSIEYAAGWDMEVQVVSIDASGATTSLAGGYDAWGDGQMSFTVEVPQGSAWVGFTVRQTQHPLPDSTRWTADIEVF